MARHTNVALFVPHAGCPHRCSFCDQRAISGQSEPLEPSAVAEACRTAVKTMPTGAAQAEIAFFGGSFTAIDRSYMRRLLEAAAPFVADGSFGGIRVSTRPDAVDEPVLAILRSYGVTAVELGAQSMDDAVLRLNRRGHTAADTRRAAGLIRQAGFSLGLQMMTGLPGDTDEKAYRTARELAALHPDTVRIYPTVVMRDTPLERWYREGRYTPSALEDAVELCARLLYFFEAERHIPVIRLGLHAGEEMQQGRVAGPWHPAFRELCEGRLYRRAALPLLDKLPKGEPVTFLVHPAAISKAVGHKRENIRLWEQQGYHVRIRGKDGVLPWQIEMEEQTKDVNR